MEYIVGKLNFFSRLFIRFDQIEGSKQKAIAYLQKVIESGRYFPPFAKTLLSAIYVRENQPEEALLLMREVQSEFPEKPLVKKEIKRVEERIRLVREKERRP